MASNVESEVVGDIVDEMKTLEFSYAIQRGEKSAGEEQFLDLTLTDEKIVDYCKLLKDLARLNGIFGNSGENSNGTVHPAGMFSGKR